MARTVVRPKGTEEGSPEWLRTTASLARDWAAASDRDARELVKYLSGLREHDWSVLTGGEKDWSRLCLDVLGYDPAFLAEMEEGVRVLTGAGHEGPISEDQALGRQGRPKSNGQERVFINGTVSTIKERGENSEYLRARLKRDHPDIAKALARGEYPSARAAAIAAGIVRVPTALEVAQRAYRKLSKREREKFITWLGEQNGGEL